MPSPTPAARKPAPTACDDLMEVGACAMLATATALVPWWLLGLPFVPVWLGAFVLWLAVDCPEEAG